MRLVHQHDVVLFKCCHIYCCRSVLVLQFCHLYHLHTVARCPCRIALVERQRREPAKLQFLDVLARKALLRRYEQHVVEALAMVFLCIVKHLLEVDVHHKRLSRTGGTPYSHLAQFVGCHLLSFERLCVVALGHLAEHGIAVSCYRFCQRVGIAEVSVEVSLHHQQFYILEMLPAHLVRAPLVYLLRVAHDVSVILLQLVERDTRASVNLIGKQGAEFRASVLVVAFAVRAAKHLRQLVELSHSKQF